MSEPMRFSLKHHGQLSCVEHCPEGEYVLHSDYARLKDEVERLTKAGDKLHAFLINYIVESRISSAYLNKLDDGWLAAKEGKPRA